jgi:hypothetical protein
MGASVDNFIHELILDRDKEVEKMIKNNSNKFKPNEYINKDQTFTALNICSSYGSINCANILIQNGWDIELDETKDSNSNLMLACKFGFFELTKLYAEKYKCSLDKKNNNNIDALDISVIYCQYPIAFYLVHTMKMQLRSEYMNYQSLIKKFELNMFNIKKFYECLVNKVEPNETGSFSIIKNTNVDKIEKNFGKTKEVLLKEKLKKKENKKVDVTSNAITNNNNIILTSSFDEDLYKDPHQIDVIEEMKNNQGYIDHDIIFYKSYS